MVTRHTRIVDRAITRLKLRQLRLLVAVGDFGSIQHAARELQISQPAATKLIQDLELDIEVQLFERTNRGVVPTDFGEALIRHGKLIISQVSNAAQELDDLTEGSSGRVVIGTLLAAAPILLPTAIETVTLRFQQLGGADRIFDRRLHVFTRHPAADDVEYVTYLAVITSQPVGQRDRLQFPLRCER